MSWRNLATKNMLRNLRNYLGYLLAATVAVTVFAMFTNFVDNPAVRDAPIAATARQLLVVFRVLVALFAVFFVFYFHAALIRARNKEFGLLLTLGVTPRQIGRLIWYESLLMGGIALLLGIGLGLSCSYLFQLAMQAILGIAGTIPFIVTTTTFVVTGIFFGVVFGVEASMIGSQVAQRTPQMLLLGARRQQQPPKASWGLMLLGLVCLGTAYDMALQFSREIALTMIPIVTLTIYGTYLLFSQAAVRVLTALRRPGIPGMRLLLIARLSHRMHDYARMLTVVTVLNAVVLTGMGTINGALQVFIAQSLHLTPFSLQLSTNAAHPTALRSAQVRQAIVDQHLTMQTVVDTPLVDGEVVQGEHHIPVSIMAFSDFLRMQEAERQAHPDLHENQQNVAPLTNDGVGHLATPDVAYGIAFERSQLVVNDLSVMMLLDTIEPRVLNTVFGIADDGPSTNVVVVTDAIYSRVMGSAQSEHRWTVSSFVLPNWQQSQPVVDVLHHRLPESQQVLLTDTVTNFTKGKQFFSVMLFADFFISGLFFLAAGSAIYFKLFTQQEEDRRQFHALERIGFQRREAARLLNREFLLLFLLPISLALVHSVVALIDLSNLMMSMLHGEKLFPNSGIMVIVLQAFVPVSLIYLGGFALYFWIARLSYLRRMQLATASPMKV